MSVAERLERGLAAGADDYLSKPFRYEQLVPSVEEFLGLTLSSAAA